MENKPYTNEEIREKWHETANSLQEIKSNQERASHLFEDHQRDDTKRFGSIDQKLIELGDEIKDLKKLLEPVSATYNTVVTLGTWAKVGLGFLLLVLSVFFAIRSFFVK